MKREGECTCFLSAPCWHCTDACCVYCGERGDEDDLCACDRETLQYRVDHVLWLGERVDRVLDPRMPQPRCRKRLRAKGPAPRLVHP